MMKASLNWLKDYVDIDMHPEGLAETLTMAGIHVAGVEKKDNDSVFEFEITSNRSDCLSMVGIAREIAAITEKELKLPFELIRQKGKKKSKDAQADPPVKITIIDKDLCPRYTGRVISGIKVSRSPDWIKEKLSSIGLREVNNIVDITNLLLMETGQPMHAFDLKKIKGGVVVRRAKKGEKIKVIDGSTKVLEEGMLVIADSHGPIAIAGVMGGLATEVSDGTTDILLESAYFDPVSVRRTSRKLGLSSESSYRFERKVDMGMILPASHRACGMIVNCAGGSIGATEDAGDKKEKTIKIKFSPDRASKIIGVDIPSERQKKILEALGFSVSGKKTMFNVTVPAMRRDILQEVDITEEIARIYGYNRIPETIPKIIGNTVVVEEEKAIRDKIRMIMVSLGANEIISYNLVPSVLHSAFINSRDAEARVVNPLSQEQEVLTETLILGMLKAIARNVNRKNAQLSLFEIGKVYRKQEKNKYIEELTLSIGMTGRLAHDWITGGRNTTFYDLKGVVIGLLKELGMGHISVKPITKMPYLSQEAVLEYKNEELGRIGKVKSSVMKKFDADVDVYTAEINLERVKPHIVLENKFEPIPKYPPIIRDISIVVAERTLAERIVHCITSSDKDALIKDIKLISMYRGKQIPRGKVGLLYRIEYRDNTKTLTDSEIDDIQSKIKYNLASRLGVLFR